MFWNLLNDSQSNKAVTHSLLLTGHKLGKLDEDSLWSILLSTNFVRHSFSLPIHASHRAFAACLLTTHENEGVTYIVLQEDPAPKICIQNLTSAEFQVMECGAIGLSAVLQTVPSCCEVIYDPSSLAKLNFTRASPQVHRGQGGRQTVCHAIITPTISGSNRELLPKAEITTTPTALTSKPSDALILRHQGAWEELPHQDKTS